MTRVSLAYVCMIAGLFLAALALGLSQLTGWSILPAVVGVPLACWGFDTFDAHFRGLQ